MLEKSQKFPKAHGQYVVLYQGMLLVWGGKWTRLINVGDAPSERRT